MFVFYQLTIGVMFWLAFPALLFVVLVTGTHRRGLLERLGWYRHFDQHARTGGRIWFHAASIGEIKAAGAIISHIRSVVPELSCIVTTMTIHGRDYGRTFLPPSIPCYLAPLDVPGIVGRVISRVEPDIYVCLETELWPLLLRTLHKKQVPLVLLNARLSDKSIASYQRLRFLFAPILRGVTGIAAISETDRERFLTLGADHRRIKVTGNVKYDVVLPVDSEMVRRRWRARLGLDDGAEPFIAGSTHAPEEALLLPLYRRMSTEFGQSWIIAPRHLSRLAEIEDLFVREGIEFIRLSEFESEKEGRKTSAPLVLVDTIGDLADLYSIAAFVFIGGSLTDYGGHNVMEAAVWNKVVFFGPFMQDFHEAALALEASGGGFRVASPDELERHLVRLLADPGRAATVGRLAGETARRRQGIVREQAELVLSGWRNGGGWKR